MIELSPSDKLLLDAIQDDLPLISRPFAFLAGKTGYTETDVLNHIKKFTEQQIIRDISAIINAKALGYHSSLVAVSIPLKKLHSVSDKINAHPGVSHNYLREDDFNIWFTLTLPAGSSHEETVKTLLDGPFQFMMLPALKTYKIGVHFRFDTDKFDQEPSLFYDRIKTPVSISSQDKIIIRSIQEPVPAVPEPWKEIANKNGLQEDRLIQHLAYLKNNGIIKRISATLRHRQIGIEANGMACFSIPEECSDQSGQIISSFNRVTHCYKRKAGLHWPYILYAMVHGKHREECEKTVQEMAKKINCNNYKIVFSLMELKKERVKYYTNLST